MPMPEQPTPTPNAPADPSWAAVGRKLFGVLCGMRLSLVLLAVILAACVAGSVVPQGQPMAVYTQSFGQNGARLIEILGLDAVFTSPWFVALAVLLGLNLILCSLRRFPQLWRRQQTEFDGQKRLARGDASFELPRGRAGAPLRLSALGCRRVQQLTGPDGRQYEYAALNKAGLWGSWLCHLGMLLVMAGFALGQLFSTEAVVYGIPGSSQPIGESGYTLAIDDFEVALRDDYTVEQYTAALTVTAPDGRAVQGAASVNHPMSAFGMTLYQDSTGWASYLDIAFDGALVQQDLLCAGEFTAPDTMPGLVLLFNKFYPDLVRGADGSFSSATPLCQNPHALYSLYYNNQMLGMDLTEMGAPIQVDRYTFTLRDPVQYTLIVVKTDPTAAFVAVAALLMLLGILLAFYHRPAELWTDGETLWAKTDKAPGLLKQTLAQRLNK